MYHVLPQETTSSCYIYYPLVLITDSLLNFHACSFNAIIISTLMYLYYLMYKTLYNLLSYLTVQVFPTAAKALKWKYPVMPASRVDTKVYCPRYRDRYFCYLIALGGACTPAGLMEFVYVPIAMHELLKLSRYLNIHRYIFQLSRNIYLCCIINYLLLKFDLDLMQQSWTMWNILQM